MPQANLLHLPSVCAQLLQAATAALFQAILLAYITYSPLVPEGMLSALFLTLYALGRIVFFFLREDECYKSKRSYTTLHISLLMLCAGGLEATYAYAYTALHSTGIAVSPVLYAEMVVQVQHGAWVTYTLMALIAAGVNFLVQGLHHHDKVRV